MKIVFDSQCSGPKSTMSINTELKNLEHWLKFHIGIIKEVFNKKACLKLDIFSRNDWEMLLQFYAPTAHGKNNKSLGMALYLMQATAIVERKRISILKWVFCVQRQYDCQIRRRYFSHEYVVNV